MKTNNQNIESHSINQTVDNVEQTAISFDEILQTPGLSDVSKFLLKALHEKGTITLEAFKKAAIFIANTPDSFSPSEEVDGVSLQSILREGMKPEQRASAPTTPAKFTHNSLSSLEGGLSLSVNSRYGNSRTDVLLYALSEYRDRRLKEAFNDILEGEYQNGYAAFQDSEEAAQAIMEIGLELGELADKNYWASIGEGVDYKTHNQKGFEQFMREYVGREAPALD